MLSYLRLCILFLYAATLANSTVSPINVYLKRERYIRGNGQAYINSPGQHIFEKRRQLSKNAKTISSAQASANPNGKKKILVTGLGVVSGVGTGVEEYWNNIINGVSGIDKVKGFNVEGMTCQLACEIPNDKFDAKDYFKDPKEVKRNDRFTHLAMAAAKMSLEDAGFDSSKVDKDRFGVVIGSGIGGISWLEKEYSTLLSKGHKKVSPFLIPAMISNTAPGLVAIEVGAQGPNHGVVSACATGGHSIGEAMRYIQNGEADVMLCGGAESALTEFTFAGFNNLRAMATGWNNEPKRASRPFDAKRSGFVMGEGAGIILLESEEHALKRGVSKVYCEMSGYGATSDAFHITAPAPGGAGLARAMDRALKDADTAADQVRYINAHGTSTPYNDKFETAAIKSLFKSPDLIVSSIKCMTGHTLGAAAGLEAVACAKVLETNIIPPTINYENPDPDCDLNYCPNKKTVVKEPINAVMSTTLGFGGHNAALLFRRSK